MRGQDSMERPLLEKTLRDLMAIPVETEWIEFKEAKQTFDFTKMGRLFSALCNEANLESKKASWLVLGVTDSPPRRVVGTQYRAEQADLDSLKKEIADKTTSRVTFKAIHELRLPEGRVLLFEIPPAPRGIPVAWEGHYYGREGESLAALSIREIEEIRRQGSADWSRVICDGATRDDLEPAALTKAREEFGKRNATLASHMAGWSDEVFLNKAKLTVRGRITRTALLLLGRPQSTHFLTPAHARITWVVKDTDGNERDFEHFEPPFLLTTTDATNRIRNLRYRYMGKETLFPTEVSKYDPWVLREALHNAVAHQDYSLGGRVNLVEEPDAVLVTNTGAFIPGSVESVIEADAPPEVYRNRFLADAMATTNMIDTIGSGIRRMFTTQRDRCFPLPDYDLSKPERVAVKIYGKVLDEGYTRMLLSRTDLTLEEVMALDQVQKNRSLTNEQFKLVKARRLVEGRRPNLYVAASVAAATDSKAQYIRNRAFDRKHYKQMVIELVREFGPASRQEIDALLLDKLSDALTQQQKRTAIKNLLQEMSRHDGSITAIGGRRYAKWVLTQQQAQDMEADNKT